MPPLYARRNIVLYSKSIDRSDIGPMPRQYRFGYLTLADLKTCEMAKHKGRLERFQRRFIEGFRCAGFYDRAENVVSYAWYARGGRYCPEVISIWKRATIALPQDSVFFLDCRTEPAHERMGLYRYALKAIGTHLAVQGYQRAWIETDCENIASRRGIAGAGFRQTDEFSVINILGSYWMARGWQWKPITGPIELQ